MLQSALYYTIKSRSPGQAHHPNPPPDTLLQLRLKQIVMNQRQRPYLSRLMGLTGQRTELHLEI
jgi:hypothetical protein